MRTAGTEESRNRISGSSIKRGGRREFSAEAVAARITLIQGRSGRFKSSQSSAKKFTGLCFHCGKAGHMKSECFALKKSFPQSELNKNFYLKSFSFAPFGSHLKEKD